MAEAAFELESTPLVPSRQPGPGRPSKLSLDVAAKVADAVAKGSYWEPACEAAGVSYAAVRKWVRQASDDIERGETEETSEFVAFFKRLSRAQAQAEVRLVEKLETSEDWRAQAFILERRHRDRWGKNDQPQAAAVTINIGDKQADALLELMRLAQAKNVTPSDE